MKINRLILVTVVFSLLVGGCKSDKKNSTNSGTPIEELLIDNDSLVFDDDFVEEVDDFTLEDDDVKKEEHLISWDNLYKVEPSILNHTVKVLKVDKPKAIAAMEETSKMKVTDDALDRVIEALKTTTIKRYLGDDFRKAVIENGGLGVIIRVVVSPNAEEDGSTVGGNYYQFGISENYEDRILTVLWVIFDLNTMTFYEANFENTAYIPLTYPESVRKSLRSIVVK